MFLLYAAYEAVIHIYNGIIDYWWVILMLIGSVMILPTLFAGFRKDLDRKFLSRLILLGVFIVLIGGAGGYITSYEQTQAENQRKAAAAEEAAQESAQEQEEANKQKQQDKADAQRMGVPYAEYVAANAVIWEAHSACQRALKDAATWSGASSDWIPNYSWSVSNRIIQIDGDDVELANGFGAKRKISYICDYDMNAKVASIISAD